MRNIAVILVTLGLVGCSARRLEKSAVLILPQEVALNGGNVNLRPAVAITWDSDEPVAVDVALGGRIGGRRTETVVGTWKLYAVDGKEVEHVTTIMGIMAVANATSAVRKGDSCILPFEPNSSYHFFHALPGRYYAIARFSGTFGGAEVRFTTEKRWFTLVGER